MAFDGGKHKAPANAYDWIVGCLGITQPCSAQCEAAVAACVKTANPSTYASCVKGTLAGCAPGCLRPLAGTVGPSQQHLHAQDLSPVWGCASACAHAGRHASASAGACP